MSGKMPGTTRRSTRSTPKSDGRGGWFGDGPVSRRDAIKRVGAIGVGLSVAGVPDWGDALPPLLPQEEIVPFTDIPESFSRGRLNGMDLRELESTITPLANHFTVAHYGVPETDADAWTLSVGGLADRPTTYSMADLRALPKVDRTTTFECGGNQAGIIHRLVGTANWAGARLTDVLREAGPSSGVDEVFFWGADAGTETIRDNEYEQNFARSLSLAEALEADAILVYEMNGEPLPPQHGSPLRLVVPGYFGVCNVKWLDRIEFSNRRLMNRFMARDYVTIMGREVDGGIEWTETSVKKQLVKSVVARVTRRQTPDGVRYQVFGAAWSDGTPIERVEVQVDDLAWRSADLQSNDNPFAWTFWTLDVTSLSAGEHTLASRATDEGGRVQPISLDLKRTYWEDNAAFTRTIMVS